MFTMPLANEALAGAEPGNVFQALSSDDGETWEPGINFRWDGVRLWPLPCQKRTGQGFLCGKLSGHKGSC